MKIGAFSVGDKVSVRVANRGGKAAEDRPCTVIEVVPTGRVPKKKGFYSTKKYDHYSYIVVDAQGERYRPIVSRISLQGSVPSEPSTPTPEVVPAVVPEAPALVVATPAIVPPVTEYIFVLDESGSMRPFVSQMNDLLRKQIEALRASAVGEVLVTLWSFGRRAAGSNDDHGTLLAKRVPVHALALPTLGAYGGTPLFDVSGRAIREAISRPAGENTAFVLTVMTDGCDVHSRDSGGSELTDLVHSSLATDRWTHAFMVPRGYKAQLLSRCSALPSGNVVEWDVTDAGIQAAAAVQTQAITSYAKSRSLGVTRSSTYFQPNLAAVTEADLAKCTDLSQHFKRYEALKETSIRELVEDRTKKPYVIGSAFYQLSKREDDVQGYKQILLRHRATGRVFGGAEARKLIGFQMRVDAKVEPGNHGDFEIYIESTSYNRIAPRGTNVLHDHAMAVPKQPTWDHSGAFAAAEAKKGTPNGAAHS